MIAINTDRVFCPYAVGDILYTINTTNPAQRWPGTQWRQITDRFVRGADGSHPAGSTGGSWTHTQTGSEVGSHAHRVGVREITGGQALEALSNAAYNYNSIDKTCAWAASIVQLSDAPVPMDIANPYYCAYIWVRTA